MINAIAIDDEQLAHKVIDSFCNKVDFIKLQKSFTKPNEALKYLRKFPIDLLFVDIHMPGMTGINLVRSLQQSPMIIFTTAFSDYAAASYELNAVDYLLKPINATRFVQAVTKAKEYFEYTQNKNAVTDQHIFIRSDFSLIKISLADITYIEGSADYLKIHTKDRKPVITRMPMKDMLQKLPANRFVRVHRSFILPFDKVESVRGNTISIAGLQIPIGRTYAHEFLKSFRSSQL